MQIKPKCFREKGTFSEMYNTNILNKFCEMVSFMQTLKKVEKNNRDYYFLILFFKY